MSSEEDKRATRTPSLLRRILSLEYIVLILCFMPIFLFRYSFILFKGPLGYGPFISFYILIPIFIVKYKFPLREMTWVFIVILIGITSALTGEILFSTYVKVSGSLILPYLFFSYVFKYFNHDIERLFTLYLKGAFLVSLLGLLLFIDSFFGENLLHFVQLFITLGTVKSTFGIRLASTLGEPTYFANCILPAGVIAIQKITSRESIGIKFMTRWHAAAILLALVLTFSAIAFMGLFLGGILLLLRNSITKFAIALPILLIASRTVISFVPELEERFQGGLSVTSEKTQTGEFHGSSFVLYNHAYITWKNLLDHPLFGSGLGSHKIATQKYSLGNEGVEFEYRNQNAQDASSMFLRTVSELGLFGGIMIIFFLVRNRIPRVPEDPVLWLISTAIFVTIFMQLLRQGNYILNGFPFFVLCWVYTRHEFYRRHVKDTRKIHFREMTTNHTALAKQSTHSVSD